MKNDATRMLEFLNRELDACENFTSGLGSCYENDRVEGAPYSSEAVCVGCMVDRFLKTGHVPRKSPLIEICGEVTIHYD